MRLPDLVAFAVESLRLRRLRTALSGVAVAIGVCAVLVLAGLGEAAKRFVVDRFAAMGANLIMISPGRTETTGIAGPPLASERDLTLEDAEAIRRRVPGVRAVAPMSLGSAAFRYGERRRDVYVVGVTAEYAAVRELRVRRGRFLPGGDPRSGGSVVVIGPKLAREVFGADDPVGRRVRIAERRFRVIGVLETKGQSLGVDADELALVPVATGLQMFDQTSLYHVLVQANDPAGVRPVVAGVTSVLRERHRDEDFTAITQDAMLRGFRAILDALTAAVACIAAISVGVAGIGIMNVMLIAVSERVAEVGVLKALGARRRQIVALFLAEALLISTAGAALGAAAGAGVLAIGARSWPEVPFAVSPAWITAAVSLAVVTGSVFGLLPARRAAGLDAAQALRGKR